MATGIQDAVKAAGTQVKLAEALEVTQQSVSLWLSQGWVPLQRAKEIEERYGIPRIRLINPRIAEVLEPSSAQ